MDDHQVAALLAQETMGRLVALRHSFREEGVDPSHWGPAADRAADDWLLERLGSLRPQDIVLSEESADPAQRLARSRVWIIDPLDGTREFATPGRLDWAVHVALSVDGHPSVGAVALPDGTVLVTHDPPRPPSVPDQNQVGSLRLLVSASRPPAMALAVARRLGAEVVPMGSAGAKVAAVVQGRAELYVHAGGMRQWDSCAPVAVALAGGFWASRIDGSPLRYNEADVNLPDLLVCRPDLAEAALAAIAQATTPGR